MNEKVKLREKIKELKETNEVLSDNQAIKSIKLSLRQIANGKGIPLNRL